MPEARRSGCETGRDRAVGKTNDIVILFFYFMLFLKVTVLIPIICSGFEAGVAPRCKREVISRVARTSSDWLQKKFSAA